MTSTGLEVLGCKIVGRETLRLKSSIDEQVEHSACLAIPSQDIS